MAAASATREGLLRPATMSIPLTPRMPGRRYPDYVLTCYQRTVTVGEGQSADNGAA